MEALIRLCECTSKSSLDAYDILLLFLCCGSDYYVVYTIKRRILCKSEREGEEREIDVIPFYTNVIPALPRLS